MTEYTFSPILLAKAMDYKKVYLGDLNKIQNTFKVTFALNEHASEIKKMSFLNTLLKIQVESRLEYAILNVLPYELAP